MLREAVKKCFVSWSLTYRRNLDMVINNYPAMTVTDEAYYLHNFEPKLCRYSLSTGTSGRDETDEEKDTETFCSMCLLYPKIKTNYRSLPYNYTW
jgi:hypothetical protein